MSRDFRSSNTRTRLPSVCEPSLISTMRPWLSSGSMAPASDNACSMFVDPRSNCELSASNGKLIRGGNSTAGVLPKMISPASSFVGFSFCDSST